jgi:hypothetical protein
LTIPIAARVRSRQHLHGIAKEVEVRQSLPIAQERFNFGVDILISQKRSFPHYFKWNLLVCE